jgi:hypothetical protein
MLGNGLEELSSASWQFDAITAIDLVEHLPDPRSLITCAASLLAAGGILVVATGNSDAWTWRLLGSRYWYCSLPEHVSFFNLRCLARAASEAGLGVVEQQTFRHAAGPLGRSLREAAKNLGYLAGNRLRGFGVPALYRLFVERRAPGWHTARDHLAVVLARSGSR